MARPATAAHGTRARYNRVGDGPNRKGCRCEQCTGANREYLVLRRKLVRLDAGMYDDSKGANTNHA